MTAPSIKEALEDLQHFSDTQLECNPKMQKVVATVIAALATLQPSGEKREAIARLVGKHLGPYLAISPTARYEAIVREFIRELLASGLVQNEAGIITGLEAAIRAAKLAIFTIRKQGVMPNSSWESGFNSDVKTAENALAAIRSARDGGEA